MPAAPPPRPRRAPAAPPAAAGTSAKLLGLCGVTVPRGTFRRRRIKPAAEEPEAECGGPGRREPRAAGAGAGAGAGRAGGQREVRAALTRRARPARPQGQDGEGDPVL